jgi:hypothetical protein
MMRSGKVSYEIGANTYAMSYGGIGAVHRSVGKPGLPQAIDERIRLLKVHLPYHESDHVLNLAYNVLCGRTRLEGIERLRHDTAYMNALGGRSDTRSDHCRRLLSALRRAADHRALGVHQPGTSQAVERTGQGTDGSDCLHRRRRHDRADMG